MRSRASTTQTAEDAMLMQEKISRSETLLKLYIAIDEDLKALRSQAKASEPREEGTY
jgi:hypothetical protein